MKFSAKDLGTAGWDQYYGYGRIDAFRALSYDYYDNGVMKMQRLETPDENGWNRLFFDTEGYLTGGSYVGVAGLSGLFEALCDAVAPVSQSLIQGSPVAGIAPQGELQMKSFEAMLWEPPAVILPSLFVSGAREKKPTESRKLDRRESRWILHPRKVEEVETSASTFLKNWLTDNQGTDRSHGLSVKSPKRTSSRKRLTFRAGTLKLKKIAELTPDVLALVNACSGPFSDSSFCFVGMEGAAVHYPQALVVSKRISNSLDLRTTSDSVMT